MDDKAIMTSSPFAEAAMPPSSSPPSTKPPELKRALSSVRRKYASDADAIEGLNAFVRSLGVENPATTENELLMQAAPYMSESLASNLQNAWTPEERARLDAAPVPVELDHTNRDHEYIFFKQMRQSLERRMSRSSSSNSIPRSSQDIRSLDRVSRDRLSRDARVAQPPSFAASSTACLPPKPLLSPESVAMSRAEQRRSNLGAVWGETGRDVLKALDTLPEADVLLDEDNITPPDSPKYISLEAGEEEGEKEVETHGGKEGKGAERTASNPSFDTITAAPGGYGLDGFTQARQWVSNRARRASFSLGNYWNRK